MFFSLIEISLCLSACDSYIADYFIFILELFSQLILDFSSKIESQCKLQYAIFYCFARICHHIRQSENQIWTEFAHISRSSSEWSEWSVLHFLAIQLVSGILSEQQVCTHLFLKWDITWLWRNEILLRIFYWKWFLVTV